MTDSYEPLMGTIPPKVRTLDSRAALLAKLEGKSALWHRTAMENLDRAADFDRAAREVLAGATTVTVGRTTYVIEQDGDGETPESAPGQVTDS